MGMHSGTCLYYTYHDIFIQLRAPCKINQTLGTKELLCRLRVSFWFRCLIHSLYEVLSVKAKIFRWEIL
ncbi:unnamed protein product [Phytomonas sp. Hart1]|nr:unnamed protein product [Phytomonas sp. Hart1]|eukprot:CCW68303.1 unnamed protein product [Phytomonas sp. isolate Hart1]